MLTAKAFLRAAFHTFEALMGLAFMIAAIRIAFYHYHPDLWLVACAFIFTGTHLFVLAIEGIR